jgi:hypothetical protein
VSEIKKVLRHLNYTVLEATVMGLCSEGPLDYNYSKVTSEHVLLTGCWCYRDYTGCLVGSWQLIYDNFIYHNREEISLREQPMDFLKYPIDELLIVWHPKWKRCR